MSSSVAPAPCRQSHVISNAAPWYMARARLSQYSRHFGTNCQAAGQPGRLNTEKIDEPWNAVPLRPVDHEVGHGLARPGDLGPDARIPRNQRPVRQSRPVLAHLRIEGIAAR